MNTDLQNLTKILELLDDEGECTCRFKASIGVLYECQHCLIQHGLEAVSNVDLEFRRIGEGCGSEAMS